MKFTTSAIALISAAGALSASLPAPNPASKNILLTNDDGWAATNIRATYYKLKDAGYNVYMSAPVSQRSGFGGKFDVPDSPTLETDGGFSYPAAGAPSWGHEESDDHIWYFNGTPASCVSFGLTYLPQFLNKSIDFDLVVSGPNEGDNLGDAAFTGSGTIGASYNAVYQGVPAIAFSGNNFNNSFFKDDLNLTDNMAPATIYGTKIVEFVNEIFKSQGRNENLLPNGVGLNVNFPNVGYLNESCTDPTWVQTKISGRDAISPVLSYNQTTNSFTFGELPFNPLTLCLNGDCSLPSESYVVGETVCAASVSVYSVDYDANEKLQHQVFKALKPLF
ncbi:Acid phosphatase [Spathaspora sp. JA1]|nr:Acid phosphatase [Spathaspora sp. JA1]